MLRCPVLCFSQAPPKGGGIAIQGPTDDRADGSSDRGFLEFLNISISNSMIEGNVASEGGGVWSAWPMLVINTRVWGNTAQNAVSINKGQHRLSAGPHTAACTPQVEQLVTVRQWWQTLLKMMMMNGDEVGNVFCTRPPGCVCCCG